MNFVQTLEEALRDLAAEARRRHPGVKEASERATLRLRALQGQYVAEVRRANSSGAGAAHPTTRLFASSEVLHPFLLAANYPNASERLLEIAFRAMRILMEADAVLPADGVQMLRVWMIQAQAVAGGYQKLYAKEIQQLEQRQQAAAVTAKATAAVPEGVTAEAAEGVSVVATTTAAPPATATASTTSSSWFSWGSSSSHQSSSASTKPSGPEAKPVAVAQPSRSAATTSAPQSPAQLEQQAKRILSCLLQLLGHLRPHATELGSEPWTGAVALASLWLHYVPGRAHTVHQAARSTLRQVLTLLFAMPDDDSGSARDDGLGPIRERTWEDLLLLSDGATAAQACSGAFAQCRKHAAQPVRVYPPAPEFALELLTQILRDTPHFEVAGNGRLLQRTMGVTVKLLQDRHAGLEKTLRTMQWTCVLVDRYRLSYPTECRELFGLILKPIVAATETCRKHDDFEDGYVFENLEDSTTYGSGRTKLATLIPSNTLWKAGFALEAVHHLMDHDDLRKELVLLEDSRILVNLSETLSDFATIGASCMDHILQLVCFVESIPYSGSEVFSKVSVKVKPDLFRKAEQAFNSGNILLVSSPESAATTALEKSSAMNSSNHGILGETLWMSLQGILRILDVVHGSDDADRMLEQTFAPSLAVLQHYLKRCVASNDLVHLALKGYANLADICLPMSIVHRKALLLSICKLSLPTWGKRDVSCQLQDHHIMTLLYLCRIIHTHFESISDDWDVVIRTLDELSIMSIASKQLSDEAYHGALALSVLFSRLAPFTTCFSSISLMKLAEALTETSKSRLEGREIVGNDTVLGPRTAHSESSTRQTVVEETSISSKIINMGARAIYGSGSDGDKQLEAPLKERSQIMFFEDYRREFMKRLTNSKSVIRVTSVGEIPAVLAILADTIMANSFRFEECGDQLSEMLSALASGSPAVRPFIMDILSIMAMSHLSNDKAIPAPFIGPGQHIFVEPMQSQLWAVEAAPEALKRTEGPTDLENGATKSQTELLSPLCLRIRTTDKPDMAESSLGALNSILEGVGQNMAGDVWCHVINAVASLSGDPAYDVVDRTSHVWANSSSMAFRCLKFIVDDFRHQLTQSDSAAQSVTSLLDCCSSFGRSKHDLNMSLTAITLLWTIADQDQGSNSIDEALSRLVDLVSDPRAEVRNAAVNTIFSCIVGRGGSFNAERWEDCFTERIFRVYDLVATNAGVGESVVDGRAQSEKRYRVSLHHSRDSNQKQWLETQTLVLRGLARVLRNYFSDLLYTFESIYQSNQQCPTNTIPWFQDAWVKILDCSFEAATHDVGRDTLSIRTAGIELMVLCCQLACDAGIGASATPARVGTNMEIINGALRTVRESQHVKATIAKTLSTATHAIRKQLYLEAFDAVESFSEATAQVTRQSGAADETQIQILHSFVSGLLHIYECSKANELVPQDVQKLNLFENCSDNTTNFDDGEVLESRFVRIVAAMLAATGGYSTGRFLNQGQRVAFSLLRLMASNGSALAFEVLTDTAGHSFFLRKSETPNDSDNLSVVNYEASDAVSQEVMKETVPNICKGFVLYQILRIFLSHFEEEAHLCGQSYANFITVLTSGLTGLKKLPSTDEFALKATELVWGSLTNCLTRMLSPISDADGRLMIQGLPELLKIISTTRENVSNGYEADLCTVLSFGATKALFVATQHNKIMKAKTGNSDGFKQSQERREELLALFQACVSTCCILRPNDEVLKTLAKKSLSDALEIQSSYDSSKEFEEEVALIICRLLQNENLESLVISVFSQLSRLATAPVASLRDAVGEVFRIVDVAAILESARVKCEVSEERARHAEEKLKELTRKIQQLQQRNVELTQEVAVLQASTAM